LENKQIEFANGGWVMHDDATTTYTSIINQETVGHQYLLERFGKLGIPKCGWTIDPFGCSSGTAKMNSEIGFKYHAVHRINLQVKEWLLKNKSAVFMWGNSITSAQVLTHIMIDGYCSPADFNFEDNKHSKVTPENIAEKARNLTNLIMNYVKY
jgi:hypothetical protein